jgi:hypothetical protein
MSLFIKQISIKAFYILQCFFKSDCLSKRFTLLSLYMSYWRICSLEYSPTLRNWHAMFNHFTVSTASRQSCSAGWWSTSSIQLCMFWWDLYEICCISFYFLISYHYYQNLQCTDASITTGYFIRHSSNTAEVWLNPLHHYALWWRLETLSLFPDTLQIFVFFSTLWEAKRHSWSKKNPHQLWINWLVFVTKMQCVVLRYYTVL